MQVVRKQEKGRKKGVNFRFLTDKSAFKVKQTRDLGKKIVLPKSVLQYIFYPLFILYTAGRKRNITSLTIITRSQFGRQRVSGAELAIAVSYPKNNCFLERRENIENV